MQQDSRGSPSRHALAAWRAEFVNLPRRKRYDVGAAEERRKRVAQLMRPRVVPPVFDTGNSRLNFWNEMVDSAFRPSPAAEKWQLHAAEVGTHPTQTHQPSLPPRRYVQVPDEQRAMAAAGAIARGLSNYRDDTGRRAASCSLPEIQLRQPSAVRPSSRERSVSPRSQRTACIHAQLHVAHRTAYSVAPRSRSFEPRARKFGQPPAVTPHPGTYLPTIACAVCFGVLAACLSDEASIAHRLRRQAYHLRRHLRQRSVPRIVAPQSP
jgi:hypothetical protein